MCEWLHIFTICMPGTHHGGQKRASQLWELELQATVSYHVGARSPERLVNVLDLRAFSLAPPSKAFLREIGSLKTARIQCVLRCFGGTALTPAKELSYAQRCFSYQYHVNLMQVQVAS